ncbi:GTP cyclohydrolase FolE2 [Pseudoalteromonas sp. MTN2-4]|uniref:GTP cyclohydrolase FolE2 n=1 Tax=Pseudoalteromonas sp. MTN2-4 TaxID=3056555 RepID=UPI0036F44447
MMNLPDITSKQNREFPAHLKWVGMENIAVPLLIEADKNRISVTAQSDLFVSLDSDAKGIHMSRLYLLLNEYIAGQVLDEHTLAKMMDAMLSSQKGLSQQARLNLKFELPLLKPALLSNNSGYNAYPIEIEVVQSQQSRQIHVSLTIPYSSTCPCSAALSRQLLSDAVESKFCEQNQIDKAQLRAWLESKEGSIATPHSQRSYAYIQLSLEQSVFPNFADLVTLFEQSIGTPVQTAVKREDEQAFAALNAENLMFCEDAARRLKATLESMSSVTNYQFKIEHQESLHAHNAVVHDSKF